MTITEFLLARIAEDEEWTLAAPCHCEEYSVDCLPNCPARVLAECTAKRRIVEMHPDPGMRPDGSRRTAMDHWCWEDGDPNPGCETTRALASVYSDHPDYRQEWRADS